ncbi:ropporin-1-like protein isoform X1 [Argonauta hians]
MPVSNDEPPYYCSEQINIPIELPDIMKEFTKAAIRTQPKDVLGWSTAYFVALYNGEEPPTKDRYEAPSTTQKTDSGLTLGILKIFNKQININDQTTRSTIEEKWQALSLTMESLDEICYIGNLTGSFLWKKFLVIAVLTISGNMPDALKNICDIVTDDLEGGPSRITYDDFEFYFDYLLDLNAEFLSPDKAVETKEFLKMKSNMNEGFVQPSFFKAKECQWNNADENNENNENNENENETST